MRADREAQAPGGVSKPEHYVDLLVDVINRQSRDKIRENFIAAITGDMLHAARQWRE